MPASAFTMKLAGKNIENIFSIFSYDETVNNINFTYLKMR